MPLVPESKPHETDKGQPSFSGALLLAKNDEYVLAVDDSGRVWRIPVGNFGSPELVKFPDA